MVNVFCITNIKKKTNTLYVYHEGNGRKSPDEVCSFLSDYLKENNITELRQTIAQLKTKTRLSIDTFYLSQIREN